MSQDIHWIDSFYITTKGIQSVQSIITCAASKHTTTFRSRRSPQPPCPTLPCPAPVPPHPNAAGCRLIMSPMLPMGLCWGPMTPPLLLMGSRPRLGDAWPGCGRPLTRPDGNPPEVGVTWPPGRPLLPNPRDAMPRAADCCRPRLPIPAAGGTRRAVK